MSFDLHALREAVARHGRVARVVITDVRGSSPREVGASMLVWPGGQSGTIGGGALEYQAAARALTTEGFSRHALGPDLGQCCGGSVTLLTEQYDAARLKALSPPAIARGPGDMPLAVARMLACARGQGVPLRPRMVQGWFVEPVTQPQGPVWIWGAGHVGRALTQVLAPLPDIALTWCDIGPERFPDDLPDTITTLPAQDLPKLVPHAPPDAAHLILTYSHEIDLALCHALLTHGFAFAGLIGSDTKWARFRKRLAALGHADATISRICCPIGHKPFGKHPHAIAVGVASQLLTLKTNRDGHAWQTRFSRSTA